MLSLANVVKLGNKNAAAELPPASARALTSAYDDEMEVFDVFEESDIDDEIATSEYSATDVLSE